MSHIGYIRVSTVEQNTDRQLSDIMTSLDKVFTDKCSGCSKDRPQLSACLEYIREGDTLYIHSLDRLARNIADLLTIVSDVLHKGVTVIFHTNGLTFTPGKKNPNNDLMLAVLGAVAQFERSLIHERQLEGIAKAKAAGRYSGKNHRGRTKKILPEQELEILMRVKNGEKKAALASQFNVSRQTIYRLLKAQERI